MTLCTVKLKSVKQSGGHYFKLIRRQMSDFLLVPLLFLIIYDPISLKMARQPLAIKIPAQGQLYG